MKICVIGGSYFLGRWFVQLACQNHEITVINRGNVKIGLENVKELVADRKQAASLETLEEIDCDCIVDFCAYEQGDIRQITESLKVKGGMQGKKYIFISTVDVYERGTGLVMKEDGPLEQRVFPGQEGAYVAGKVLLEDELQECCKTAQIQGISVRPAILYGPANYATREKLYFDWISQNGQIVIPAEEDGRFSLLYVKDAAQMILKICESGNEKAYNLLPEEETSYNKLVDALSKAVGTSFEVIKAPLSMLIERQIPIPFPATALESEHYGSMYELPGIERTPLEKGLSAMWKLC